MKHKIRTQLTYVPSAAGREKKSNLPGKTIPDQSMTLSELVRRYVRGLPISGGRVPEYDASEQEELSFDDFMPDLSRMDLASRQEWMETAKQYLEETKVKLDGLRKAREAQNEARKKQEKEDREELQRIREERQKKQGVVIPAPSAGGDQ